MKKWMKKALLIILLLIIMVTGAFFIYASYYYKADDVAIKILESEELIREVCLEKEVEILEMEVMPEHVHLLLDVDPQYGIHRAVKTMKGKSSRELRREFSQLSTKLPTLWSNSYFVSTTGGAPLEQIKTYIQNQKTSE